MKHAEKQAEKEAAAAREAVELAIKLAADASSSSSKRFKKTTLGGPTWFLHCFFTSVFWCKEWGLSGGYAATFRMLCSCVLYWLSEWCWRIDKLLRCDFLADLGALPEQVREQIVDS